jgi:hypothetical protein
MLPELQTELFGKNCVARDANMTLVSPKEFFNAAIVAIASSIVLVHNHLSGNPSPSDEDKQLTGEGNYDRDSGYRSHYYWRKYCSFKEAEIM